MWQKGQGETTGTAACLPHCSSARALLPASYSGARTLCNRSPACVFWWRKSKLWDGCCGSQSPMYPSTAKDCRELRMVVLCAMLEGDG